MAKLKTALIVHGYNLHMKDWDYVVWGDPQNGLHGLLGRISTALLVAYHRKPVLILWNTGATEKDGMSEARYTYEEALRRLPELEIAPAFKGVDLCSLERRIKRVSNFETESGRTSESIRAAIPFLTKNNDPIFDEVVQVTSKNHAPRVLRDSCEIWWEEQYIHIPTSVYPSHIGTQDDEAGDVKIIE